MKIRQIIDQMTLEEKASLCSGSNGWESKGVERLQVPSVRVSEVRTGCANKWKEQIIWG